MPDAHAGITKRENLIASSEEGSDVTLSLIKPGHRTKPYRVSLKLWAVQIRKDGSLAKTG